MTESSECVICLHRPVGDPDSTGQTFSSFRTCTQNVIRIFSQRQALQCEGRTYHPLEGSPHSAVYPDWDRGSKGAIVVGATPSDTCRTRPSFDRRTPVSGPGDRCVWRDVRSLGTGRIRPFCPSASG